MDFCLGRIDKVQNPIGTKQTKLNKKPKNLITNHHMMEFNYYNLPTLHVKMLKNFQPSTIKQYLSLSLLFIF